MLFFLSIPPNHKISPAKNINSTDIISKSGISLFSIDFFTNISLNNAVIPITIKRLNMLEPTTFPSAMALECLTAANVLTASSGREVPTATIVSPITIDGTLSLFATAQLPSTK